MLIRFFAYFSVLSSFSLYTIAYNKKVRTCYIVKSSNFARLASTRLEPPFAPPSCQSKLSFSLKLIFSARQCNGSRPSSFFCIQKFNVYVAYHHFYCVDRFVFVTFSCKTRSLGIFPSFFYSFYKYWCLHSFFQ